MEAKEIFEALKRTSVYNSVYNNAIPEEIKLQILTSVWNECAKDLLKRFGPTGQKEDDTGFGYLVEEFAKRSPNLPKNTDKAERLARQILADLGHSNPALGLNTSLYNPDFLWLKITGRKITVIGIGEVKSSLSAFLKKEKQAAMQEDSIRTIVVLIERAKEKGFANEFFAKRKIVMAKQIQKLMIVPAGKKEGFRHRLPPGWECREIEFSYDELLFVAKKIWPQFWPGRTFKESALARYEKGAVAQFFALGELMIENIFEGERTQAMSYKELFLFSLATKKIPLDEEEMKIVAEGVREAMGAFSSLPEFYKDKGKSGQQKIFQKLSLYMYIDDDDKEQLATLINHIQVFNKCLEGWLKKHRVIRAVQKMDNFDPLKQL